MASYSIARIEWTNEDKVVMFLKVKTHGNNDPGFDDVARVVAQLKGMALSGSMESATLLPPDGEPVQVQVEIVSEGERGKERFAVEDDALDEGKDYMEVTEAMKVTEAMEVLKLYAGGWVDGVDDEW